MAVTSGHYCTNYCTRPNQGARSHEKAYYLLRTVPCRLVQDAARELSAEAADDQNRCRDQLGLRGLVTSHELQVYASYGSACAWLGARRRTARGAVSSKIP